MSNNLCGGSTQMPYRAGRIDALSAGTTTGVPAPETPLEETLVFFERAGLDAQDAIGITACGHTMGSVHHGGFPDVVDDSFVTPNNTNGGSNFDTSRAVFDANVVAEYVHWTGNKGGPLVTSYNDSMKSDLRLYESDGNATMRALLAQGDGFLDTCVQLMARAIDTVPAGVQLGPQIMPLAVKPVNVTYEFGADGKLVLSGRFRVLNAVGEERPGSLKLRVGDDDDDAGTEISAEAETGQSVFGVTTYFPFSLSGASIRNATSFSLSGAGIQHEFHISSQRFVVPSLTALEGKSVNVTVAIPALDSCDDLTVRIAAPFTQPGTLAPKMDERQVSMSSATEEDNGYRLCVGTEILEKLPTGLLIVEALVGETIVDALLVDGGMAGW